MNAVKEERLKSTGCCLKMIIPKKRRKERKNERIKAGKIKTWHCQHII